MKEYLVLEDSPPYNDTNNLISSSTVYSQLDSNLKSQMANQHGFSYSR